MKAYTPEDLVLYLYHEMDASQRKALEEAMETDWTLREKMGVLKTTLERLDQRLESPRTEVILNILRYASNTQVQTVP
ncbi:MAG: hypothetical protein FJY19_04340 [Bacteroidetes bacterium]|nr:hypothetical protein [Bacteroidota bacterium]